MLIFLMSLVSSKRDKTETDLDAIFEELGLDNNPQIEVSVNELFELLEEAGITFTEAGTNFHALLYNRTNNANSMHTLGY